ncbi:hypothetical protein ACFE35_08830 [Phormidesmis priestleyi ANT.L61.2]
MNSFFSDSQWIDCEVLRPLSHIHMNWELQWDTKNQSYIVEEDSFAETLNTVIKELEQVNPPARYHDNEDRLAEFVRDRLRWSIYQIGGRWVGADYASILEQGGFDDIDETNLLLAIAGRIKAAQVRKQHRFDEMEESHQRMLATVLSVVLYRRS